MAPWYIYVLSAIGALMGALYIALLWIARKNRSYGVIIIDTRDPERDIYRLELGEHLETLSTKKKVIFDVRVIRE